MVQLKLGVKTILRHHAIQIRQQLRTFSSQIAVTATDPKDAKPGASYVITITFEFDVANDEVYQALEDQCREWVEDPSSVVVAYTPSRCGSYRTAVPETRKKTTPELWSDLVVMDYQNGTVVKELIAWIVMRRVLTWNVVGAYAARIR